MPTDRAPLMFGGRELTWDDVMRQWSAGDVCCTQVTDSESGVAWVVGVHDACVTGPSPQAALDALYQLLVERHDELARVLGLQSAQDERAAVVKLLREYAERYSLDYETHDALNEAADAIDCGDHIEQDNNNGGMTT